MVIAFITDWTPTRENIGPSAHLYHLLCNRPKGCKLIVFSTNINKICEKDAEIIGKELRADIRIIPRSFFSRIVTSEKVHRFLDKFNGHSLPANSYYTLPKSIKAEIDGLHPDIVWIYPHSLIKVARLFPSIKKIVTGADCASLHTSRLLRDKYTYEKVGIDKVLIQFRKRANLEQLWAEVPNVWMHLVGQTDKEMFQILAPNVNCQFFPHPHYSLVEKKTNLRNLPLKVLISGKYDVYTYSDSNIFVDSLLCNDEDILKNSMEFTFHGKGWTNLAKKLIKAGFHVAEIGWVDDYVQFIKEYDIQIFPISVGSGTKGKVLDGLSTGLLCIGSRYAFENIAIIPEQDCIIYNSPREIPNILLKIIGNVELHTAIAESGRLKVRKHHVPSIITKSIIDWCTEEIYSINSTTYYHVPLK